MACETSWVVVTHGLFLPTDDNIDRVVAETETEMRHRRGDVDAVVHFVST